jgi:hypothetical protein
LTVGPKAVAVVLETTDAVHNNNNYSGNGQHSSSSPSFPLNN